MFSFRHPRVATVSGFFWQKKLSSTPFNYPKVKRDESVVDDYFGVKVPDPYRWLEDPDSAETKAFVEAQNTLTRSFVDGCEYKDKIQAKMTKLWNYPKYSVPDRWGDKYFQYRNTGLQNQNVLYVMDKLDGEAKVFFDPNTLSKDGTIALVSSKFSEDGKTFAYGLSSGGSDWIEIRFRNVETGRDYPEVLKKVKFSTMSWMHDNKGFFYSGYLQETSRADGQETDAIKNQKLYYHELGTDQSQDKVAIEFDDPQLRISSFVSDCGNYLVVHSTKEAKHNLIHVAKLEPGEKFNEKLKLTAIQPEFTSDLDYITNVENKFYFRTSKNAPNYRLVEIDINNPAESEWKDFIPEHKNDVLYWAYLVNNTNLIVCYLKDVKNIMQIFDLNTGKKIHDFDLEVGSIAEISGRRYYDEMFYNL